MGLIDQDTVRRILDTANIVEVVSDYVSLKRRGAGYVGLCPFHNERTPSFNVSPSRGYCKCFSCGKGGSAVGFIMEIEQCTYPEALRHLAKKYNIEVHEAEQTDEQRRQASLRESMLTANERAQTHFVHNLQQTDEGRDVALTYLRERGISDAAITEYRLGYAMERGNTLLAAEKAAGIADQVLLDVGLVGRSDRDGSLYDNFHARVTFPIMGLNGRVLGFGARILNKAKSPAKYKNSPESLIYHKSNELYGLYQARRAIVKADRCFLVEGYLDVISMYQAGLANVVASSGTSLTEGQIRLLGRFTRNVTLVYDGDEAGIHASLRGIDMLLAEGLNIRVLMLPDGHDPDSFAQSRPASEVVSFFNDSQRDFMAFKIDVLGHDLDPDDPVAKAKVVSDIVKSISFIPDEITRQSYVGMCSRRMGIPEKSLALQVDRLRNTPRTLKPTPEPEPESPSPQHKSQPTLPKRPQAPQSQNPDKAKAEYLRPPEQLVIQLVMRYGMVTLCEAVPTEDPQSDGEETLETMTVLDFIRQEMEEDQISFVNPDFRRIMEVCMEACDKEWPQDWNQESQHLQHQYEQTIKEGQQELAMAGADSDHIHKHEEAVRQRAEEALASGTRAFAENFLSRRLTDHPDEAVRSAANALIPLGLNISRRVLTSGAVDGDKLTDLVPKYYSTLKLWWLTWMRNQAKHTLKELPPEEARPLLTQILDLNDKIKTLSAYLGEAVIPNQPR